MVSPTKIRGFALLAVLAVSVGMLSSAANAQLNSNSATVTLNATLAETLTVSATPAAVNFVLAGGAISSGSAPVVINTSWLLKPSRANVVLDGYFASANSALSDNATVANTIPTSEVFGQVSTGSPTTYTAFTQAGALGPAGAGLTLFTQAITGTNRVATRTDNLNLQINLTSHPLLPAGTYTGTLTLQAQAI